MVYNDSEFVADRKIIELNQIENTEADVFYEGWLQDRRHKIKNEDLELNKGKTTIFTTLISYLACLFYQSQVLKGNMPPLEVTELYHTSKKLVSLKNVLNL